MRDGQTTLGYGVVTGVLDDLDLEQFELEKKAAKKAAEKAKKAEGLS